MKNKNFITITLIIIVLALVYVKQKRSIPVKSISGGYSKILPDDFNLTQFKKITFFSTGKEDKAVILEREKEEDWFVPSLYNIKGNKQSITNLLNDLKNLEGEERASTKEVFSDFGIQDQEVYHLVLYGAENKERYHLLIGKSGPNYNDGFIRFKDKNEIYLVNKNLRSLFGISGTNHDQLPDSKKWSEKKILEISNEKIAKITLNNQGKKIILEKKESEWRSIEPALKDPINKEQIDSLISVFGNFLADDFADPQKITEYGIKESLTSLVISSEDKKEYKLFLGKKEGEKYYLVREGEPFVYLIGESRYKNSFEKIGEIIKPSKKS